MNLYYLSVSFSILWIVSSTETQYSHSRHSHHHHHHDHHHHNHHDHDHDHRQLGAINRCGTHDQSLDEQSKVDEIVKSWEETHGSGGPKSAVTIPTFFHIVYSGLNGVLTDTEVRNQLNKLNSDFSGTGFQFTEAAITRTENAAWHFADAETSAQTAMKQSLRQGGATSLNVYLNGVLSAGRSILGYATFPTDYSCNPQDDGVVVDYGTLPGGYALPYNEGATLTHEVGHWLGLYHVFQGGCFDLDFVSDTAAQAIPTSGCPSNVPDTCVGGGPDNINNFMDYSYDECLTEFTSGQNTRIAALWSFRQNPPSCNSNPGTAPTQPPTKPPSTEPPTDSPVVPPSDPPPCFSPNVSTNVLGKGTVLMKDIVVGDKVLTESGEYKTIFTISHFHPSRATTFIQLHSSQALDTKQNNKEDKNTQPLELTPRHMVFLHGRSKPIPASDVKVGDELRSMKGPQRVTKVSTVIRNGIYNPITTDGTIVVGGNSIIASTYTSYTGTSHIEIGGQKLVSFHTIADLAYGPYKSFCTAVSLDLCNHHTELSGTNQAMKWLYNQWATQNEFVKFVILSIYLTFFYVLNIMLRLNVGLLLLAKLISLRAALTVSSYVLKTKRSCRI